MPLKVKLSFFLAEFTQNTLSRSLSPLGPPSEVDAIREYSFLDYFQNLDRIILIGTIKLFYCD